MIVDSLTFLADGLGDALAENCDPGRHAMRILRRVPAGLSTPAFRIFTKVRLHRHTLARNLC